MAHLVTSSALGIGKGRAVSIVQTQYCSRKMIYCRGKGSINKRLIIRLSVSPLESYASGLCELWADTDRLSYIAFVQFPSPNNLTTNSTNQFDLVHGTLVVEQVLSNRSGYLLTLCYSRPNVSHRDPWNEQRIVSRKILSKTPYIYVRAKSDYSAYDSPLINTVMQSCRIARSN